MSIGIGGLKTGTKVGGLGFQTTGLKPLIMAKGHVLFYTGSRSVSALSEDLKISETGDQLDVTCNQKVNFPTMAS